MISREEAERKSIMCSNKTMCCQSLVKDIYNSIGSCSECNFDGDCQTQEMFGMENDWFCADFVRK